MIQFLAATVGALMNDPDLSPLVAEYEAEARSPELPPAAPQWEHYQALERAGLLDVIVARDGRALIGFVSILRADIPHYGGAVSVVESLFVTVDRRKTGAGRALIRAAEAKAADCGAVLLITAPAGSTLETILPRLGYRHSNTVFAKRLP